ncbi:hypothetical protein BDD12DRAFT_851830, partial [Trichophaea hybrida]
MARLLQDASVKVNTPANSSIDPIFGDGEDISFRKYPIEPKKLLNLSPRDPRLIPTVNTKATAYVSSAGSGSNPGECSGYGESSATTRTSQDCKNCRTQGLWCDRNLPCGCCKIFQVTCVPGEKNEILAAEPSRSTSTGGLAVGGLMSETGDVVRTEMEYDRCGALNRATSEYCQKCGHVQCSKCTVKDKLWRCCKYFR